MYYVMFYGGIACASASFIYAIYIFSKKNIRQCIKNLMKLSALLIVCTVTMGYGTVSIGTEADNDKATSNCEKTEDKSGEQTAEEGKKQEDKSEEQTAEEGKEQEGKNEEQTVEDSKEQENEITIDEIRYIDRNNEAYSPIEDVIWCGNNKELYIVFRVSCEGDKLKLQDDGTANVFVRIKGKDERYPAKELVSDGTEDLHDGENHCDYENYYSIKAFSEKWQELEDGLFDGCMEICVEDINGEICTVSTGRIIYGEKEPEIIMSAVDDEKENSICDIDKKDSADGWTSDPIGIKISVSDEVGISNVSYRISDNIAESTDYGEDTECNFTKYIERKITVSESSKDTSGVPVVLTVTNVLGNVSVVTRWIHTDSVTPTVFIDGYENDKGVINVKNDIIYSNTGVCVRFNAEDIGSGLSTDNIEAEYAYTDTEKEGIVSPGVLSVQKDDKGYYVYIPDDIPDNVYDGYVTIRAKDRAGNQTEITGSRMIICKKSPKISWSSDIDMESWTNKDILLHISCNAPDCGIRKISYYVAGNKVKEDRPENVEYVIEQELLLDKSAEKKNGYIVEIRMVDNCGNECNKKQRVYIDKNKPELSVAGADNDTYHSENVRLKYEVSDISFTDTRVKYDIVRVSDEKEYKEIREDFVPKDYTDSDEFVFSKEGEYTVNAVAVDGAGNRKAASKLQFVIDKTAPEIFMRGIKDNDIKGRDVKVDFLCEERYYESDEITINVARTLENRTEKQRLDIFEKNSSKELKSYIFSEEGQYEVTMDAKDKAGNTAVTEILHFIVDKTAPEIYILGTEPYRQWEDEVRLKVMVKEEFFQNNKVALTGSISDMDEESSKLLLPKMQMEKKSNTLSLSFDKDGVYGISVSARDGAGNVSQKKLHFLIDRETPVISGIDKYDGKYLKEFEIGEEKEEMFRDLTLKSCGMTLNGIEYDGCKISDEGRYVLTAYAEDELGHRSEKRAEFVVDHTAPEVIFTGADDGDTMCEKGIIKWKLLDDGDEITGVTINDKEYDVNLRELSYNSYGDYNIRIDSIDNAGNEGTSTLTFRYAHDRLPYKNGGREGEGDGKGDNKGESGYRGQSYMEKNIWMSVVLFSLSVGMLSTGSIMLYRNKKKRKG